MNDKNNNYAQIPPKGITKQKSNQCSYLKAWTLQHKISSKAIEGATKKANTTHFGPISIQQYISYYISANGVSVKRSSLEKKDSHIS